MGHLCVWGDPGVGGWTSGLGPALSGLGKTICCTLSGNPSAVSGSNLEYENFPSSLISHLESVLLDLASISLDASSHHSFIGGSAP